ncbi:hypothetical protein, partial [Vallitalea sediminicola]
MKSYFFIIPSGNSTTAYANMLFASALRNLGYNVETVADINKKYKILEHPDCDTIFFQKTSQQPPLQ